MSIFLTILIDLLVTALPYILKWISGLVAAGETMTEVDASLFRNAMSLFGDWITYQENADTLGQLNNRKKQRLKRALDFYNQIKAKSGQAGCEIK